MPLYSEFDASKVTGSPDHPAGHNAIETALNTLRQHLGADLPEHLDGSTLVEALSTYVASIDIRHMVVIEESAYAELDPPDPNTFYIVVEDS